MSVNPFQYGGIVGKDAFCNRTQELRDLKRAAQNAERLLVYAERRMGKTSLLKRVLAGLSTKDYLPIYVDLWATSDALSFATTVAKAVAESAETRVDRMFETAKELFAHLVPALTIDDAGNPSIQFGARQGQVRTPQISDVLDAPSIVAKKRKKTAVVVYDEIQRIAEFGDDTVERALRSRVQEHTGVTYFFLGSRKHLIQQMFSEKSRPLYKSAGHYPLTEIDTEHWLPFISERFNRADKGIEDRSIEELCLRTGGHPYYTQHFAHDLWEIVPAGHTVVSEHIDRAEQLLLRRLDYTYMVLYESLSRNQRRLLRALASASRDAKTFSAAFLGELELAPSSVHQSANVLLEKDIIDRDREGYVISDRFFTLWLRNL